MALDIYDDKPEDMIRYLKYYGWHFNHKMCNWAVSKMERDGKPIKSLTKQQVDDMLKKENITINNNHLYDYVYIANMCLADFYGSSIADQNKLVKFIKDYLDDPDGYEEIAFSRFYIDTVKKGIPIDWEEMV